MPTAIITGAASGIGRATALKLAARNYHLALAGRTQSTLQKVAEEIAATGAPAALVVPTDVSREKDIANLIQKTHDKFGRIDVLVNNAGLAPSMPTVDVTPEQWHAILDTNLSSAFYATRLVWPIMKSQPAGGVIINISSMAAKDPFPGLGAYAVAKAGINMLTLITAREGAPHNIRVVAIAPSATDTPMFRNLVGEANVHPEQILKPENIADAILSAIDGPLQYASGDTIYLHKNA